MEDRRLAVHRTIVVVDVEGFGDQRRTNRDQVAVRDGLYRALRDAFGRAGISWDDCGHEDRGDGVFVLVPAEVPKALLAESLPSALVTALRAHNGAHPGPERIRLRMALHAGEVHYDQHGVTAVSVNLAFRLLDASALKAALASSPGLLAVITSSWFFEEVVRHSSAVLAYRPVEVAVKETTTIGWICLPDHLDPAGRAMLERLPAGAAVPGVQPAAVLRTLPRDTAAFTGRTRELDRLVAAVCETAAGSVIGIYAVDGMAGIGKTAFAVHAAHQLGARFPDGQIFLRLHAHTAGQRPVDPAEALATLLLTTGVAPQQIPPDLEARSAAWRGHLAGKKMLLVLDDAAGSDQVRPLLPGAAGCLVLVTSRRRLTALEEAAPISLGTLPPGEAADLLVCLAARPGLQPADAAVAEVTGLCGYLPLAIRLVAAGLRHHPAWTLTDLSADLGADRDRLAALQAEDVSVAAAFDLSYQDLTAGQQRLFRRLGLHPGADIDAYAAAALDDADLQATRRRLGELYDQNLIGEPARGRYRLHDLLREHARARAVDDGSADSQAAIGRLLDYYLHAARAADRHLARPIPAEAAAVVGMPPAHSPYLPTREDAVAWMEAERLNMHAAAEYAATDDRSGHATAIPAAMHGFLRSRGHWDQALALHRAAVKAACHANDWCAHVGALTDLGDIQYLTGDYSAATSNLTRALELYDGHGNSSGGPNARSLLGAVQRLTGDYPAALASLTRALELYQGLGNRLGEAGALRYLGLVQQTVGDYPAAAASLARALELVRDFGDPLREAGVLSYLGTVQRLIGDYTAAVASLARALDIYRDLGNGLGEANALNDLAAVQQATGDYSAAAATLAHALELHRELGHPVGEADALNYLGALQYLTGDYSAAAATLTRALELHRDLGNRLGEAEILNTTGGFWLATAAVANAHTCYRKALAIATSIASLLEEARALEGIGRCHFLNGRPGEAAASLRQALRIYQRIGSPNARQMEVYLHDQHL